MLANPQLDFAVFPMLVFSKMVGDSTFVWQPYRKDPLSCFLKHDLPWQTMQPIWKRDFLLKLGGFDETFKRLQDVELHTRALLVKDVCYQLLRTKPDCYYRIDEVRKNFNAHAFMKRWIDSAVAYFNKYFLKVDRPGLLYGTVFRTYLQLILHRRNGSLTKQEFDSLERDLFCTLSSPPSGLRGILLKIAFLYNRYAPKVPGVNFLLFKLIVLQR